MELNGNKRDVAGWLAMLGNAWLLINAGKAAASPQ
jgi:hypothetical protein